MTPPAATAQITEIGSVFVPVSDQDSALDIRSDHALLRDRGVDVDAEIAGTGTSRAGLTSLDVSVPDSVPAQFFFRDPDGNRFLMVQPG